MNLINTDIKPDPFDPHRGDVYESGGPFPQRIVVEDPPTSEDPRIRYRVDGGCWRGWSYSSTPRNDSWR